MRRYKITRAAQITRDLDLIEDHLFQAYQDFGEESDTATDHAAARIEDALTYIRTFATHPHRGTEHPTIRPGLRTVTNKNFVFWSEIDEASSEVKILAIFFSNANHGVQIMDRLRN